MKLSLLGGRKNISMPLPRDSVRAEDSAPARRRGHRHGLLHLNDGASRANAMYQDRCTIPSVVHTTWPVECEFA